MSDVATLRIELKLWEREFRAEHGRDPSVQDIKVLPAIAEKYKLYKRLSKFASAVNPSTPPSSHNGPASVRLSTPPPPTTPPQKHRASAQKGNDQGASLLLKSRAVATAPSVSSINPFSPAKRGPQITRTDNQRHADPNPFISPAKQKSARVAPSKLRSPSPELFATDRMSVMLSGLFPDMSSSSVSIAGPSIQPTSNLIRARKRLRGEPVSPSPKKDKRRRVLSKANLPPFARLDMPIDASDDNDDVFIEDSPVKQPSLDSAKPFQTLFDEDLIPSPDFGAAKIRRLVSSDALSMDEGSSGFEDHPPTSDGEDEFVTSLQMSNLRRRTVKPIGMSIPSARFPTSNNLRPADSSASASTVGGSILVSPDCTAPARMPSFGASSDESSLSARYNGGASSHTGLMPPSPAPVNSRLRKPKDKLSASASEKAKGKQRVTAVVTSGALRNRRTSGHAGSAASGTGQSEADDASDLEEPPARVYDWNASRHALAGTSSYSDFDPEFDFALGRKKLIINPPFEEDEEESRFEVSLPDHLKRVLALSPRVVNLSSAAADDSLRGENVEVIAKSKRPEDAIVRAVVSGMRLGHYDSGRGGEIWDAGEVSGDDGDGAVIGGKDGEDDDWEAEGVPWEVGEL